MKKFLIGLFLVLSFTSVASFITYIQANSLIRSDLFNALMEVEIPYKSDWTREDLAFMAWDETMYTDANFSYHDIEWRRNGEYLEGKYELSSSPSGGSPMAYVIQLPDNLIPRSDYAKNTFLSHGAGFSVLSVVGDCSASDIDSIDHDKIGKGILVVADYNGSTGLACYLRSQQVQENDMGYWGMFSVQGSDSGDQFGFEYLGPNRKISASGNFRVRIEGWEPSRSIKEYVEELGYSFPVVAAPVTDFYYLSGYSFNIMEYLPASPANGSDQIFTTNHYRLSDENVYPFSSVSGEASFQSPWSISSVFWNSLAGCQARVINTGGSSTVINVQNETFVNLPDKASCQEFAEKLYQNTINVNNQGFLEYYEIQM